MPRGLLPWGCNMNFLHWGCKRESRESCLPWEELGEYRGFLKEIKCVFSHEKKKKGTSQVEGYIGGFIW